MRNTIKKIVVEEFSKLTNTIESDFKSNYRRKVNNFLLSQMDENITASMVFVSSFESKSGFAIETCAKRIARLKFGEENVPAIVNPRNLEHNIPTPVNGQIIVTDVDTNLIRFLYKKLRVCYNRKNDRGGNTVYEFDY